MFIERLSNAQINEIIQSAANVMIRTDLYRKLFLKDYKIENAKRLEKLMEKDYTGDEYEVLQFRIKNFYFLLSDYDIAVDHLIKASYTDPVNVPILLFNVFGEEYEKSFRMYAKSHYSNTDEQLNDWLRSECKIPIIDKPQDEDNNSNVRNE